MLQEGTNPRKSRQGEFFVKQLHLAQWVAFQLFERDFVITAGWNEAALFEKGVVEDPVVAQDTVVKPLEIAALQSEGFDARAIRPPSVAVGQARLRVSVNAGLAENTLDRFVDVLAGALEEAALC